MLSNFTSKKSDKEAVPVNTSARPNTAPPGAATGQTPMPPPRLASGRPGDRAQPSVIGPDLTIMGNLISSGEVQVDGEVQGDLHGTHVVVGEKARITGGIMAQEIVVRGHVMGSIRGSKIMLQASSHVEGDVHHTTLAIEQGAYFEGKSRRSEDPLADVVRPQLQSRVPEDETSSD
ncbi:MAG: polymer-forming cytoskeletal protein [Alphaproteobacteria bacterium]|nr:polymer-forming cytoskeletal protein [Alphaproteobacteria bacterium]